MGHLGRLKEEYRDLVARLDRGPVALPEAADDRAEAGRREILEILFSPEEAAIAARMPVRPIALDRLAARLGMGTAELEARLDPMCERGVALDLVNPRTVKRSYMLAPPVVGFFEYSLMRAKDSIPKKRMAEALHAYTHGDPAFAREAFGRDTVIGRALVHEPELADEPLPDVLAWERASEIVGAARKWSVSLCFCRHKAEHLGARCDAPMENCLSLNGGAEYVVRRNFGREIGRTEALEVLARAREGGLVQIADNVKSRPTFLCNCCGCCCEQLQAVSRWGLAAVNPSGFVPRLTPQPPSPRLRRGEGGDRTKHGRCAGCSRCARACPVGAIAMDPVLEPGSRRNGLAPRIDEERCVGCGLCAGACQKGALEMVRGGRARPVPANTVERVVRMAIERSRLAELLFDEGDGLGARFLQHALDAIVKLPPAQAMLASEQVRSRFVRAALSRFGKLG